MAIRSFQNADIFSNAPRMLLVPDGGDGSGAGGSDGGAAVLDDDDQHAGADDKKFTQSELDKIVQDRISRLTRDLKKKSQQDQQQLQKQVSDLEEKIKSIGTGAGGLSDDGSLDLKTLQGKLEVQKQKHDRDIEALQTKLADAEKGRLAAEERQRFTERDTEIQQALVAAGCLPSAMVAAQRYFTPQVEWDSEEGDHGLWLFKTSNGNTLTISEGIAAELPPYFKSASQTVGGSGTSSTKEAKKRGELQKQIEAEETKLVGLQKEMRKSGNEPRLIAEVMTQSNKVKKLKLELASK